MHYPSRQTSIPCSDALSKQGVGLQQLASVCSWPHRCRCMVDVSVFPSEEWLAAPNMTPRHDDVIVLAQKHHKPVSISMPSVVLRQPKHTLCTKPLARPPCWAAKRPDCCYRVKGCLKAAQHGASPLKNEPAGSQVGCASML